MTNNEARMVAAVELIAQSLELQAQCMAAGLELQKRAVAANEALAQTNAIVEKLLAANQ